MGTEMGNANEEKQKERKEERSLFLRVEFY